MLASYTQTAASVLALKSGNKNLMERDPHSPWPLGGQPVLSDPTLPGLGCKEAFGITATLVAVRDLAVHVCHSKTFLSGYHKRLPLSTA